MAILFTKPEVKTIWTPSPQTIITDPKQVQTAEDRFYYATLDRLGVKEEEGFTQRMNNASRLAE
jgi:hypothetical protein